MNRLKTALLLCALASSSLAADSEVTLEKIMAHPDWLGRAPENWYWADDGQSFYWERKVEGTEERKLYQAGLDGNPIREIQPAERGSIDVDSGAWSRDFSRKVYSRQGDIYVKEMATGEIRQLTRSAEREHSPFFMADETAIAFERGDAIFIRQLADGLEAQAADLKNEDDPEAEEDEPGHLEAEQLRLFDYLRTQKEKREAAEDRDREEQAADATRSPLPYYLGAKVEVSYSSLSPNGRWLLVGTTPAKRNRGERTPMPMWVTESGDIETRNVRPKVGDGDLYDEQLVLIDLETREQHALDLSVLPGITDDPLADLKKAAEARKQNDAETPDSGKSDEVDTEGKKKKRKKRNGKEAETQAETEEPKKPRPVRWLDVAWSRDGERVALSLRASDNKDRWIATIDFPEASLRTLHHLHDEAWINWRYNNFGWLLDDQTIYYLSEEAGYSGLYILAHEAGAAPRTLAEGAFTVSSVQPTRDGASLYYRANKPHPGIYEIYRVGLADGETEAITDLGGVNSATLSPDGSRLLVQHSSLTRPSELFVQDAIAGASANQVTQTLSEAFSEVEWSVPEIVEIPSSHVDRPVYSRLYRPTGEAPGEKRPAVVFVHGAGYLQNAHQGWSGYFREFMFHTLLTRRGYVVLDMDYRASAGYGRDWRTAIYRQMGTPELEDLQDGVQWLTANENVDPARIGVYGGSYGGFMTMMALFKDPDLFAAGAALRPVTDWAHYNHGYTSNILNTPEIDPEAFARSSPIEFADGLENPLLICAPMLDDNVFFQDTVRLIQKLIELEKITFETALFPVEPHGFREPSSWLHEYRKIYGLFERYVRPAE